MRIQQDESFVLHAYEVHRASWLPADNAHRLRVTKAILQPLEVVRADLVKAKAQRNDDENAVAPLNALILATVLKVLKS